ITTPFNPSLGSPERPEFLPINVEDLYGFVNFSKKQVGLTQETNLVEILNTLSEKINPLAIGAVHRAREKNKKIASTLLGYHMKENEIIEEISEIITTGLFEHSFVISRKDAKNLKLPIESIDDDMEKDIWTLFKCYADIMQLSIPYNPESLLNSSDEEEATFHRALLEHLEDDKLDTYTYSTKRKIFRKDIPDPVLKIPLPQILERDIDSCWHINNDV
ncbi:MAG: hypothetical protein GYA24_22165, partial [Candidatus Lokiarchaeota archaeon]|nr:hypothetical protein [Candidatus Lokiarchaeota archaeon]